MHLYIYTWAIGLMSRVFACGPGDQGSIPGQVIPKTQKMVFDPALLNTQHYKVMIKGKVERSREWSIVTIKKRDFKSLLTSIVNFTYIYIYINEM